MTTPEEIISDEQIDHAWGNADFGPAWNNNKRGLINETVLDCASGYSTGSTAKYIVRTLGLVTPAQWRLTRLGRRYLNAAFRNRIKTPTTNE